MSYFGAIQVRDEDGNTVGLNARNEFQVGSMSLEEVMREVLYELRFMRVMLQEISDFGNITRGDVDNADSR